MSKVSNKQLSEKSNLTTNFEIKTLDNSGKFTGYASVFEYIDSHLDIVKPGAFTESIINHEFGSKKIQLLWQHKADSPIGCCKILKEDNYGLYVEAELFLNTQAGKEAYTFLKEGVINSLSIGYTPIKYYTDSNSGVRVLEKIDLWEISLVTFPANAQAQVTSVKTSNHPLKELNMVLDKAINVLSRT
jgi:HK97 family phage prohead protease